jgi:hypothetical protein
MISAAKEAAAVDVRAVLENCKANAHRQGIFAVERGSMSAYIIQHRITADLTSDARIFIGAISLVAMMSKACS